MPAWSRDWPSQPGLYWFYGRTNLFAPNEQLCIVKAESRGAVIVIEGLFETAVIGFFQMIEQPTLPREDQ